MFWHQQGIEKPAEFDCPDTPHQLEDFLSANYRPLMYTHPSYIGRVLRADLSHPAVFAIVDDPRFGKRINRWLTGGLRLDKDQLDALEGPDQGLLLAPWAKVEKVANTVGLVCCYRSYSQRLAKAQIAALSDLLGESVVAAAQVLRLGFESLMSETLIASDQMLVDAVRARGREALSAWLMEQPPAFKRRFMLRLPVGYWVETSKNPHRVALFVAAAEKIMQEEAVSDVQ